MNQSSQRLNFDREPTQQFLRHLIGANQFECDPSARLRLQCFVDRAHPASSDLAKDLITADL